ncbi:unnamed protein product [[Candida] boidinii]|nr:unnamed protein product [[Candida] boidinii]
MDGSGAGQGKNKKGKNKNKNKNKKNKNKNKNNSTTSESIDAPVPTDNSDEFESSEISSREQTPIENEQPIAAKEITTDTEDQNKGTDNKSDIDTITQENTMEDASNNNISTGNDKIKTDINEIQVVDTNDLKINDLGNVNDALNKEEIKDSNEDIPAEPGYKYR